MILTEKQQTLYDFIVSDYEATGKPVTASRVVARLGLKPNTVYDRLHSLERFGIIACTEFGYIPDTPPEPLEKKPQRAEYIDHGRAQHDKHPTPRNPITWDEVKEAAAKLEYGTQNTPLKYLKRIEVDETGEHKIKHIVNIYPVKAYPHGVLCTEKIFVRWADVAIFYRNPARPIGESYWRDFE